MRRSGPDRRFVLKAAALPLGAAVASALPFGAAMRPARAAPTGARHGLSIFGDLKYPAGFSSFDYVRPDAPKEGRLTFNAPNWFFNQDPQTYDTLNSFVVKGSSPPRMELCFDTLMVRALDEPDAIYGLIAEAVEVSEDRTTYLYHLRPEATFHDGTRITAEDVAFSYNLLKDKGHPNLAQGLREMVNAEAIDAGLVEISYTGRQSLSAPLDASGYPVFSKAYWEGRDFQAATREPILGSGAYRVGAFEVGRFIEYERVPDYWAAKLGVNIGQNNFETIRLEFFRERAVEFEAFKKGIILHRQEFTSKTWATEYTFPAIADGRVKKVEFPAEKRPSMQGWFYNLRRPQFQDIRVREALGLLFDFEWTNKNLFYGLYERRASFFGESDYAAAGEPTAAEAALLEPFRSDVPEAAFGSAVVPPVSDGSGRDRSLFRRATTLLGEAGWTLDGGTLRNQAGQTLSIEFMIESSVFERVLAPYVQNLRTVGVDATIRLVDPSQGQSRRAGFDFDVISAAFSMSATPVESLDGFFHSRLASVNGSYNLSGVANPAVDAMVARAATVDSREELIDVVRAMDRVLRALHIWIPNWYASVHRVALWDVFGWPETKPDYGFPVETTWWIEPDKAAALAKG